MANIYAYAPTDVQSVSVGNGCGDTHKVIEADNGGRGIGCPQCALALLEIPSLGWAGTPHGVKLTVDENAALEEAKATGLTAQSLAAKAIGEKIAELVLADKPKSEPQAQKVEVATEDVLAALDGLPQDQLAALLKRAGLASDADDSDKPEPIKRSPGRPRKQA
jgi:hypothetical protein